jgi:hypothetical protein
MLTAAPSFALACQEGIDVADVVVLLDLLDFRLAMFDCSCISRIYPLFLALQNTIPRLNLVYTETPSRRPIRRNQHGSRRARLLF